MTTLIQLPTTLLKPGLKASAFLKYNHAFVGKLQLDRTTSVKLQYRINNYTPEFLQLIGRYAHDKAEQTSHTYKEIDADLKKILKRIRISVAVNPANKKEFAEYWLQSIRMLRRDATVLCDYALDDILLSFEVDIQTL